MKVEKWDAMRIMRVYTNRRAMIWDFAADSRRSASGCDFNRSMQHLLETVLPGFQAREFCRDA
jgi:hypothetical protein